MAYIAVTAYTKNTDNESVHIVAVSDDYKQSSDLGWVFLKDVPNLCLGYGYTPINFSIDRNKTVRMDCGDFQRFSQNGSAVVLAELKSRGGKIHGYKLLSCANGAITNLKVEDILQRERAYGKNNHFLQNGIIRGDAVHCYPLKPFPSLIINAENRPKKEEKQKEVAKPKKQVKQIEFTKEQLAEIAKCESNGINSRFIRNPKLSPQQMRVLWVSKSKGALSETFANPALSTDAMKFYADRLYSKKMVEDCRELLNHPELSTDELSELYICICEGVPYAKYIGKSAMDISVARETEKAKYWGSSKLFDTDYYEKALNVARKIKGF